MPDNVTLPGTGERVATDDDGTAQHQYVKLEFGADGVFTKVDGANRLPVATGNTQVEDAVYVPGVLMPVGGVRRDADTSPVSANGDVHPMVFNSAGRLKVSAQPAIYTATTGNITGVSQNVSIDVSRASNVMFYCTGTFSTVNVTFEGSIDGGTNWFAVQAIRSNANTIETTTGNLSAAPAYAWEASVNALTNFRLRSTAWTSGTQVWTIMPGAYATEPIPAAQVSATQPVSGTVAATQSGTWTVQPGNTANTTPWLVNPGTPTANILNSAATTNGTIVKGSAGTLYSVTASNTNAAARFLKFHNSATVTVGTTAVALTIPLPPGAVTVVQFGPLGMRFGTGICLSTTALAADADTSAVAANEIKVLTSFI